MQHKVGLLKSVTIPKFSSDFIWNIISLALVGVLGLILNAIVLAWRGEATLGVFNLSFSFFIILAQIAVCGVQLSVLQQCSWRAHDLTYCRDSLKAGLLLVSLIAFPVSLGVYYGSSVLAEIFQSPPLNLGLKSISIGVFFFCLNKVLTLYFNAMRHMRSIAIFQALRFILLTILLAIMLWFNCRDGLLPLAISITECILFLLMLGYLKKDFFPILQFTGNGLGRLLKSHLSFGLRGFLSGFLVEMNTRVDILMLGLFVADEKVGVYSFVAAFAEGFAQIIIVMRRNIDPLFGKYLAQNQVHKIESLSKNIRKYFYPLMCALGLVALTVFPFLLKILGQTGNINDYIYVLAILIVGFVLISGYNACIGILLQGKRPGTFTLIMLLTVMSNILINILLIPHFGIYGAAIATSCSFSIQTVFAIVTIKSKMKIRI